METYNLKVKIIEIKMKWFCSAEASALISSLLGKVLGVGRDSWGFSVSTNKFFIIENSSNRDDFFLFVLLTILGRIREEINGQNQSASVFQSKTHFHLCQGTLLCCSNSVVSDNFCGDKLSLTGSQNLTQSVEIWLKKNM